jgi:carbonic anhydrase
MRELQHLFNNNKAWVKKRLEADPETFNRFAQGQTPKYLWIGCSDSRIPANEILELDPGEVFVHRNVANLCPHTDFNFLSVLQYGIDYLSIEHVIVCGHYRCGGIAAAMENMQFGLVDNWLRLIRDVYARQKEELELIDDTSLRYDRLVELNVLHQVMNVCYTTIVQNAWANKRKLTVHGWVYDVSTGYIKDLNCCISSIDQIDDTYRTLKLHL